MPKEYIEYQNKITSADDLNKQGRKSDVLIEALNKCEKLEEQLKIAVEALDKYANKDNWKNHYMIYLNDCELELRVFDDGEVDDGEFYAQEALKQIGEIK